MFYIFLLLLLTVIISILALMINSIQYFLFNVKQINCTYSIMKIKKISIFVIFFFVILILLVIVSQLMAHTPTIKNEKGNVIQGSIAELKKVDLNGRKEWISIRGVNKDAPVLLFLAGGPGGTQMSSTRYELAELEKHFVVVNWDQPGSGKSFHCMNVKDITVQTYIDDGIALTEYLRDEFSKDKIYIMGESWGSAYGVLLISKKPEYYKGMIGTGQMVAFKQTEIMDYEKAIEIAKKKGNVKLNEKLMKQGKPPYYDGNIALLSSTYLSYLSQFMSDNPEIYGGYHTIRDIFSSEYGILDSINYFYGLMATFNVVYPQLYEIDLREDYTELNVPIYFFIGRHDINAPVTLTEEYYDILHAPKKELIWFEHSGHGCMINENDLFIKETLRVFQDD